MSRFLSRFLLAHNIAMLCVTGLYLDAQAALDYAMTRSDLNQSKLIIFGRSLGGAVAIQLASVPYYAVKIHGLVIENTFTTLPEIGKSLFDFKILSMLPEWCFKNKVGAINSYGSLL